MTPKIVYQKNDHPVNICLPAESEPFAAVVAAVGLAVAAGLVDVVL